MNEIKAIETVYRGYRFRSRLEAKWAIFFDVLGVRWQYEPETFDLTDVYLDKQIEWQGLSSPWPELHGRLLYTPDFLLPDVRNGLYVEIKPYQGPCWWGDHSLYPYLFEKACMCLGGIIAHGEPGTRDDASYEVLVGGDSYHYFGYCSTCGSFGEGFMAWAERICAADCPAKHRQKDDLTQDPAYREAVTCARYALFTGAVCTADYRRAALPKRDPVDGLQSW